MSEKAYPFQENSNTITWLLSFLSSIITKSASTPFK
jgi:hypothetical protein